MKSALVLLCFVALAFGIAPLLHADGENVIAGSYIVILKDDMAVADRDAHIAELQSKIKATEGDASTTSWTYKIGSLVGFAAKLSNIMLKSELNHPDVQYIEADQVFRISAFKTQQGATWGLDRIDQRNLPISGSFSYNSTGGEGVSVYVIDTGILATHTDFGGRASSVFNSISGESNTDLNGHGTHCAGTIGGKTYGVAKNVKLYGVKVLSASGSGSTAGVIAGVDYVTNNHNGPTVASMSLGGGASRTMDAAVINSINSGVVYSIAAGNSNANACNSSPASVKEAITVGATTSSDARSSFSNYGNCVDIFAPGSSITSDWIGSNTAINTISGTSMACPHVSGVLALHLGKFPSLTPVEAQDWITGAATPNVITNPGTNSPNLLLYSPYA